MKYLLLHKKYSWQDGYELTEFDTQAALTEHLMQEGIPENAIVAQRVGVQMQVCDWRPERPQPANVDPEQPFGSAKPETPPQEELQREAA